MKQNIKPAIRLTLACMFFFMGIYTFLIYAGAQLAPGNGKAETVVANNRVVGYKLIGQKFTEDKYFQGRPSAVDYNAAGSGGSNKGPSNPEYLLQVQARIDRFMAHNPGVEKAAIPSDLVTASGGGLDPDISVQAALVQVKRIAGVRNLPEDQVTALVNDHIEKPLAGLFGTSRVNVLKLNIALDRLSK
ncbi:MAG TPA: K(+)-transporting ATPase subunit C [Chitinophagaceae bacterium]|nr:K(+)-transporting ATPase subunit C [Chitinophagaceae bacterium]